MKYDTMHLLRCSMSVFTLVVVAVGCSADSPDVASARLNTVTQPNGESNFLFWQDKTDLYRGVCEPGKPVNRTNCVTNIVKLPQADVLKRAMDIGKRGVDSLALAIDAEIKALKDSDPTILSLTQQISALNQQKTGLQTAISSGTAQLQADQTLRTQIDEQLTFDNQQLKEVEKRLKTTPNDQTLLDLQLKLKIEILDYTAKSDEVGQRIKILQQRVTTQQSILTKIGTDLASKQDELKKYADSLDVYSPRLDKLKNDKAEAQAKFTAIPEVIKAIGHAEIMYRGTIWPKDMQDALVLVSRGFGGIYLITPGTYKMAPNQSSSYCPQKVEITSESKILMTFLNPCSASATIECENENCTGKINGGSTPVSMTIIDATHYEFSSGKKAVFVLESPSL